MTVAARGPDTLNIPQTTPWLALWEARAVEGVLQTKKVGEVDWATLIDTGTPITAMRGLAFDQSGRIAIAYSTTALPATTYIYWYDQTLPDYTLISVDAPEGGVFFTDYFTLQDGNFTDMVFFYTRAGVVYHKKQRDRFLTENFFANAPAGAGSIRTAGFSTNWRVQIEFSSR